MMSFTKLTTSQNEFLVNYLRGTGRELTSAQAAANYGIKNLRARISELHKKGYKIRSRVNTTGKTAYAISRRMVGQA